MYSSFFRWYGRSKARSWFLFFILVIIAIALIYFGGPLILAAGAAAAGLATFSIGATVFSTITAVGYAALAAAAILAVSMIYQEVVNGQALDEYSALVQEILARKDLTRDEKEELIRRIGGDSSPIPNPLKPITNVASNLFWAVLKAAAIPILGAGAYLYFSSKASRNFLAPRTGHLDHSEPSKIHRQQHMIDDEEEVESEVDFIDEYEFFDSYPRAYDNDD